MKFRYLSAGILLSFTPQLANAHLVSARFGEFYSGILHPLTSLLHLVPWLALAILASMQGKSNARWNVAVFCCAIALGALVAWLSKGADAWPLMDIANMLSFIVLGAGIVAAIKLPKLFFAISLLFGFSHGFANGLVELSAYPFSLYLAGLVCAAYFILVLVSAFSLVLSQRYAWMNIATRVLGSWLVASGIIYTGFSFVGAQ